MNNIQFGAGVRGDMAVSASLFQRWAPALVPTASLSAMAAAALDQKLSRGARAEDNAAAPLVQVTGAEDLAPVELRGESACRCRIGADDHFRDSFWNDTYYGNRVRPGTARP